MAIHPDPLEGTPFAAISEIGKGGMGVVYEAEHRKLATRVAVKLVDGPRPDARTLDRMRLEAQALARLSSPHVVGVTHLDETPRGRPYFVMDLLAGTSLAEELKARGAFPLKEAVNVALDVLAGLEVAHAAGLLHRDIKLANLFYCSPDKAGRRLVKILDFGIAKTTESSELKPLVLPTEPGLLVGTPRYAAPEQARGERIDRRTDLYALGCVLYALLAGHGPFDHHKTTAALLMAHVSEEPLPPSRFAPQPIPQALDALVLRLLAKSPAERFATAAEVRDALGAVDLDGSRDADVGTAPLARPLPPTAPLPTEMGRDAASVGPSAPQDVQTRPAGVDRVRAFAEAWNDEAPRGAPHAAPAEPLRFDAPTIAGVTLVALLAGGLVTALVLRCH